MANIEDYIKWRGDITFEVDPFNEVDNLLLSELAYIDFDGIVGPGRKDEISLSEAERLFFEKHTKEEIMDTVMFVKVAPFFMKPMAESERFGRMKLCAYVNEVDRESQSQFSAVTFIMPDNTYFVAYRGTDSSLIGWKEDFNMSYLYETPGQRRAVLYLNDNFKSCRKPIRVGGHSKGGNFAIFAASFCLESIQNRILNVYTNDGPGFRDEVLEAPGYNRILPKITSIVPEETLVGMIQGNNITHHYVKSDKKGIAQHDATTWQVIRNHFEYVERSDQAMIIDETMRSWLSEIPDDKRERFVDVLFDVIMAGGANTTDDFVSGGLKSVSNAYDRIKELDTGDQELLFDIINKLMSSYEEKSYEHLKNSFVSSLKTNIKKLMNME